MDSARCTVPPVLRGRHLVAEGNRHLAADGRLGRILARPHLGALPRSDRGLHQSRPNTRTWYDLHH